MIYDYNNNITLNKKGNTITLTTNDAIFTKILNDIYDAYNRAKENGYNATANDTLNMWQSINEKAEQIKVWK